jgi:hypothetical protein
MATSTRPYERDSLDARYGFEDERSMAGIATDLIGHIQQLVHGEIMLAKREMADGVKEVGVAAAIGAAAWPFALGAVLLLGLAFAAVLAEAMPVWVALLIATAVYAVIAGGLALLAKARFKKAEIAPTQSIESMKEDMSWISKHTSS